MTFLDAWVPGTTARVRVNASDVGYLDAWADFNGDGDWDDDGEQIFDHTVDQALVAGNNTLNVAIPADARLGSTFVRFRLSSAGVDSYTGSATDGEVEDYQRQIVAATPGVVITPVTLSVAEGGSAVQYSITLNTKPTQDVVVNLYYDQPYVTAAEGGGQVLPNVSQVVFSASITDDWKTPKIVTVQAVDDSVNEGNHMGRIRHSASSADSNYSYAIGTIPDVVFNITDNDTPGGVQIVPLSVDVSEEGETSMTYQVSLLTAPPGR